MTRLNLDCPRECRPLQDWSASLTTRSGAILRVRPVRDDEDARLARFFEHVSPEDRRFRFPGAQHRVDADRLAQLIDVDHGTTEHFVGFLADDDEIVASALFTGDAAHEAGGVAIAIDRQHKDQGLGWTLLGHVARYARAHGYKRLLSIESGHNHGALAVEQAIGFTITALPGDKDLVLVEAEL